MDYLTIIATRSLILFPSPPANQHHNRTFFAPSSGTASPTTPTAPTTPLPPTTSLPPPMPVTMPIHSLMYADTDCAYFLLTHVLTSHPSLVHSSHHVGSTPKDIAGQAEVVVWSEIDKAKMFTRALGEWFGTHPGGIDEGELRNLANRWDLVVKGDKMVDVDDDQMRLFEKLGDVHHLEENIVLA